MKTVSCPYCEKESEVKKNGKYVCPNEDCGEEFEVDFFNTRPVKQPDDDTCGWATAKWTLKAFGCKVPRDATLRAELKVDKTSI